MSYNVWSFLFLFSFYRTIIEFLLLLSLNLFCSSIKPQKRFFVTQLYFRNVLSGGQAAIHGVVGIGANIKLPLLEELAPGQPWQAGPRGLISEFCSALTPEAVAWANRLASEE